MEYYAWQFNINGNRKWLSFSPHALNIWKRKNFTYSRVRNRGFGTWDQLCRDLKTRIFLQFLTESGTVWDIARFTNFILAIHVNMVWLYGLRSPDPRLPLRAILDTTASEILCLQMAAKLCLQMWWRNNMQYSFSVFFSYKASSHVDSIWQTKKYIFHSHLK